MLGPPKARRPGSLAWLNTAELKSRVSAVFIKDFWMFLPESIPNDITV